MSTAVTLTSGVPQGGIFSPVLFIIYVADMGDWTENAGVFMYADDTSTDASSKIVQEVVDKLERDAKGIMEFMASNGLVANPQKTVFIFLGNKQEEPVSVKIGGTQIQQSTTAKLLGIEIDEEQKWKPQVNKLITALDRRLFYMRRVAGKISNKGLKKVADSIWTSKMRYGLQLYQEVRTRPEQLKSTKIMMLQKAQNRMLRTLTGTWKTDHVKITELLEKTNTLSVNQTAAQIKIGEMWKAANQDNYPVKMEKTTQKEGERITRHNHGIKFKEVIRSALGKNSFVADATKLWNNAPDSITKADTLWKAKQEIKIYCKTLPV